MTRTAGRQGNIKHSDCQDHQDEDILGAQLELTPDMTTLSRSIPRVAVSGSSNEIGYQQFE